MVNKKDVGVIMKRCISDKLVKKYGYNQEIADDITQNIFQLEDDELSIVKRWLEDRELKVVIDGISFIDIYKKENNNFVEAIFTFAFLRKNKKLLEKYFKNTDYYM